MPRLAGGTVAKVDRIEWHATMSDRVQAIDAPQAGEIDFIEAPPFRPSSFALLASLAPSSERPGCVDQELHRENDGHGDDFRDARIDVQPQQQHDDKRRYRHAQGRHGDEA